MYTIVEELPSWEEEHIERLEPEIEKLRNEVTSLRKELSAKPKAQLQTKI